ncbi:MAG: peptide deformylase [Alphaproteobacteria bacterium]|nr:peptide deformylase [Alphaproteobacteria bacterium]MBE8219832.1 peptide deformylase [Alphaproteobacteria bacterium]
MAIRNIIEVPDKRLKQVSAPVEGGVTTALRGLMDDMLETMYAAHGIGLAAIQVGAPVRVIVMDLSPRDEKDEEPQDFPTSNSEISREAEPNTETEPRFFINPEIIWVSDEMRNYQEGCLSVPGFFDDVTRPAQCRVTFLDYDGTPQELECARLLATCIQHELDHLNGIVFLDHLSRLKRDMVLKKIRKTQNEKHQSE